MNSKVHVQAAELLGNRNKLSAIERRKADSLVLDVPQVISDLLGTGARHKEPIYAAHVRVIFVLRFRDLLHADRIPIVQKNSSDALLNLTCAVFFGHHSNKLPNESRLSCGAELEGSQTEFYYTVCQGVHRIR